MAPADSTPPPHSLRAYLADHDVPCPTCGYNLRGLTGELCPECGSAVPLWALPVPLDADARQRTALYLRHNDLFCRRCKVNLRGREDGVCPGCGTAFAVLGPPALAPADAPRARFPLLGCVLSVLVMGAILIGIVALSLWASP